MEVSASHAYYQRRLADHDHPKDARRALKRKLSDKAFSRLLRDQVALQRLSICEEINLIQQNSEEMKEKKGICMLCGQS